MPGLISLFSISHSSFSGRNDSVSSVRKKGKKMVHEELITSRIVGGKKNMILDHPYLAVINWPLSWHWCGGAILNKDWIISAAHCFSYYDYKDDMRVVAGISSYYELLTDRELFIRQYRL